MWPPYCSHIKSDDIIRTVEGSQHKFLRRPSMYLSKSLTCFISFKGSQFMSLNLWLLTWEITHFYTPNFGIMPEIPQKLPVNLSIRSQDEKGCNIAFDSIKKLCNQRVFLWIIGIEHDVNRWTRIPCTNKFLFSSRIYNWITN